MGIRKNIIIKRKTNNGANVEYLIEKLLGSKIIDKYQNKFGSVRNDPHIL